MAGYYGQLSLLIILLTGGTTLLVDAVKINEVLEDLNATVFVDQLRKTSLYGVLETAGPFTVFAPTNEAYGKLPADVLERVINDTAYASRTCRFHFHIGYVTSVNMTNDWAIMSQSADNIRFNTYLDEKILTASGRLVAITDLEASNGVVHSLDGVMIPPDGTAHTFLIYRAEFYIKLLNALQIANLAGDWMDPGPYTIFATPDTAIEKNLQWDELLEDREKLRSVLHHHMVRGTYFTAGLSDGQSLTSIYGQQLVISMTNGTTNGAKTVRINGVLAVEIDVVINNGALYVLDEVIMPKFDTGGNNPSGSGFVSWSLWTCLLATLITSCLFL